MTISGLLANPKQHALSSSGAPHVRLGVVRFENGAMVCRRLDLSIDEVLLLTREHDTTARGRELRRELLQTLTDAGVLA